MMMMMMMMLITRALGVCEAAKYWWRHLMNVGKAQKCYRNNIVRFSQYLAEILLRK